MQPENKVRWRLEGANRQLGRLAFQIIMKLSREEYQKRYYILKGKAIAKEKRRIQYKRVLELRKQPCKDCGGIFPPECMDFHHIEGHKKFNISNSKHSWENILAEVAKCILICSNCHRIRTKKELGHGRN